jgi:hypothetical protein
MTARPRKPQLVNLTWAAVLAVLVVAAYIASAGGVYWLRGTGTISYDTGTRLDDTVYGPLQWWIDTRRPGWHTLLTFELWCYVHGDGAPLSFSEMHALWAPPK